MVIMIYIRESSVLICSSVFMVKLPRQVADNDK
jgi:hypothetical protein